MHISKHNHSINADAYVLKNPKKKQLLRNSKLAVKG